MPEFDVLLEDEEEVRWANTITTPEKQVPTGSLSRSPKMTSAPATAPKKPTANGKVPERTNDPTTASIGAVSVRGPLPKHSLADPYLMYKAQIVDDLERARIASENRLRLMTRSEADSDGEERGWGLAVDHPEVVMLAAFVESIKALEKEAVANLQKAMRRHPMWSRWGQHARGIGEKQLARLLAQIGDPYVNVRAQTTRRVSSLWAYCGLHVVFIDQSDTDTPTTTVDEEQSSPAVDRTALDTQHGVVGGAGSTPGQGDGADQTVTDGRPDTVGTAPRRRRGQRANWSTLAKVRAYLIAESTVKQRDRQCEDGHVEACTCSPYRLVYDRRRAHTAVTHGSDTERPWTKGHSQNDALRIVSKAILKDLWKAARDWHISQDMN
jgi:hypothetical protein